MTAVNKQLSDKQYSQLIGVIARVPVQEARRLVLERVEQALPKARKVSDQELLSAINAALASFPPGQLQGDHRGLIPDISGAKSLVEAAEIAERSLKPPLWVWPPVPPPDQEDGPPLMMSQAEAAAAYEAGLGMPAPAEQRPTRAEAPPHEGLNTVFRPSQPDHAATVTRRASSRRVAYDEPDEAAAKKSQPEPAQADVDCYNSAYNTPKLYPAPRDLPVDQPPAPRPWRRKPLRDRVRVFFR
jgi:hypothetical protein